MTGAQPHPIFAEGARLAVGATEAEVSDLAADLRRALILAERSDATDANTVALRRLVDHLDGLLFDLAAIDLEHDEENGRNER